MSSSNEVLNHQLNAILAKLRGGYGIHWSLNRVLRHVNRAIVGEFRTDFDGFTTFNKLNEAIDGRVYVDRSGRQRQHKGFYQEAMAFTGYTEQFLESLQNKFLEKKKDITFPIPKLSPPPDFRSYSREKLYQEIVLAYHEVKANLNLGHGFLKIIQEHGIERPKRNEILVLWQKLCRFISNTLYKGQIMVRSLVEPYLVHLLLWLGLETVLVANPDFIYEQLDDFSGKGKLIPSTTVIWDGKKDQEALPAFLQALRSGNSISNPLLQIIPNLSSVPSLNPFNHLYEHRVPVDPSWLPDFKSEIPIPLDTKNSWFSWMVSLYFGKVIHIGTYEGQTGYQLPGVRNIVDAWNIKAPDTKVGEEIDYQTRLKAYRDTLYGQWLVNIKHSSDKFYNLVTHAMPMLKQRCATGDIVEQVGYLEGIKNIYLNLTYNNGERIRESKKAEKSQGMPRIPRGPARNLPPSPFDSDFNSKDAESVPYEAQKFITGYVNRAKKGLVGFKTPTASGCTSSDTLGARYRALKTGFQGFHDDLEKQVKTNASEKTFDPIKVDNLDLDRLFLNARNFAKEQKFKDIYNQYNLTEKLGKKN